MNFEDFFTYPAHSGDCKTCKEKRQPRQYRNTAGVALWDEDKMKKMKLSLARPMIDDKCYKLK